MKIVITKNCDYSLSIDVILIYFELNKLNKPYFYIRKWCDSTLESCNCTYLINNRDKIINDDYFIISRNYLGDEVLSEDLLYSDDNFFDQGEIKRDDVNLVLAVEKINPDNLKVVDIPDDVDWYICESECGSETIHENHRSWY